MTSTELTADQLHLIAQVAVEAVADDPQAYHPDTRQAVLHAGRVCGVPALYLQLLEGVA